jgi:recombination protein RecT
MATLQALRNIKRDAAEEKPKNFPAMLEAWKGEIARALPRHLNPDRMARIALTAFRRTPNLAQCDPRSVFAAVIQASQLGLEPDTLGRSYLVPYGSECQFVPGWKGLVDLVNRSGNATVYTGVIYKDQTYAFRDGSARQLDVLNETELDEATDITHAYAVGRVKGAETPVIELWRVARIRKHRDRYNRVGKRHYSYDHWEMYARKVPLLQVLKYLPMSPELAAAIALNDAAEIGEQHLNIQDAIDGSWAPVNDGETRNAPAAGGNDAEDEREDTDPRLAGAIASMQQAKAVEVLDETYIRAEAEFEGAELDVLMREYTRIKSGIGA